MGLYVAKRVLTIGLILIVISVLIFFITQGLPGNVARLIAGQFATPDVVAAVEAKLGLNDPLLTQYWRWASGSWSNPGSRSAATDSATSASSFAFAARSAWGFCVFRSRSGAPSM